MEKIFVKAWQWNMKSTCTQPKWRIEHEGMFWKVAPSYVPTSNASNKWNEDSFFRGGTRVIFVWFGALRMAFFIVSPVKQTVAIATFASQITIKTTTKKRTRKGRPIPKGSNYNVSLPDDNLESASFAHVAPNSSTQLVFISHISTWPMGTSRPVNSHSNAQKKKNK